MTGSSTAKIVTGVLLALALSACSSSSFILPTAGPTRASVADAKPLTYPNVKRRVLNDSAERDQLAHLLYVAEAETTTVRRARAYRKLGEVLNQTGRREEAMRAYEAAALQGDRPSATIIIKAHGDHTYEPLDLPALVDLVYVPRATTEGTSAALLLAELVTSGTISDAQYGSAASWLEVAASNGSSAATIRLADTAAAAGDFRRASQLYASVDKNNSPLQRALGQARRNLLGEAGKPNSKLGLGWLNYATTLDIGAAAQLAASLYRKKVGSESARAKLLEVALAGGVDPAGSSGFATRLKQAANDAEREAVLDQMRKAADGGSGDAALALAQALFSIGGQKPMAEGYHYLEVALAAGVPSAAEDAAQRLASLHGDSKEAASLIAALDKAAAGGLPQAMWALGELYAWGGPVPADQVKSLQYVRAAADAGHIEAQLRIGLHFAQDKSDPASSELARHYLAAAAQQGSAAAKAYLEDLPTTG